MLRCRVKQVFVTRKEVFGVVKEWGRADAARGRPISDAGKLPVPFRSVYVSAHAAAECG